MAANAWRASFAPPPFPGHGPCYKGRLMEPDGKPDAPAPFTASLLWRVLAAQLIGAFVAFGGAVLIYAFGGPGSPLVAVLGAQGLIAAFAGAVAGLPRWWIPLHVFLPLAAAAAAAFPLPAWVYLVAFAGLLGVFWNSPRGRVPLYLTNRRTWEAINRLLPERTGLGVIDLGCGIGGVIFYLARRRPDAEITGIESAPLPYALAWLRRRRAGGANLRLVYGDFWKEDLSRFDVVYAFLSPAPMPALYEKARAEMKAGALLVSNSFAVPGVEPHEVVEVNDRRRTRLYLWRFG